MFVTDALPDFRDYSVELIRMQNGDSHPLDSGLSGYTGQS